MLDFEIDNLALVLLIAIAGLLLYDRVARPSPLVHPLLLGKQSEVSPVRKEGESAVYRSFATGHGTPLIVRPASSLKTVRDVIPAPKGREAPNQRIILDTPLTDEALAELVRLLPRGLLSLFPSLSTDPTKPTPILVLLPPAPNTSLPLLLLSLASSPSHPLIILDSPRHLAAALTSPEHPTPGLVVVHESLARDIVKQVKGSGGECGVLIVGIGNSDSEELRSQVGSDVRFWDEVWNAAETSHSKDTTDMSSRSDHGKQDGDEGPVGDNVDREEDSNVEFTGTSLAGQPNDTHSYFYSTSPDHTQPLVLRYTHLNFTAGIAGFLSSFPADKRPNASKKDSVASSEPLNTPFGMTVALASIWSGVGFSLIGSNDIYWEKETSTSLDADLASILALPEASRPSILILRKNQHSAMVKDLYRSYQQSRQGAWAIGSKSTEISSGYLSRTGLWDKLVWSGVRNGVLDGLLGDRLRSIIVVGDAPSEPDMAWSNVLLSIPTARMFTSPFSAGPILASHFYDIQSSPRYLSSAPTSAGPAAHTGAPTSNVEVVLRDIIAGNEVDQKPREGSRDGAEAPVIGTLFARGPAMGDAIGRNDIGTEGWMEVGRNMAVRTNGTFVAQ